MMTDELNASAFSASEKIIFKKVNSFCNVPIISLLINYNSQISKRKTNHFNTNTNEKILSNYNFHKRCRLGLFLITIFFCRRVKFKFSNNYGLFLCSICGCMATE